MSERRHPKFIVVPFLIKIFTVLITWSCRVRWHNRDHYRKLLAEQKPFVVATWHNCSTIAAWALQNSGITVMISDSRDGEYVSRLAKHFGINSMRGSSSRGAKKAVRTGLELLRSKRPIAITPDGPRGPRYKVQSGVLWFAAAGGVPIIPLHIEASRQWVMNSWDGHRFPKPFSTIHVSFGEPVMITRDDLQDDIQAAAARLEQAMMGNVAVAQQAIDS